MADEPAPAQPAATEKPKEAAPAPAQPIAPTEAEQAASKRAAALHAVVEAWVRSDIFHSPVSRHVEAFNHLMARLPALEAAILKGV